MTLGDSETEVQKGNPKGEGQNVAVENGGVDR